MRTVHVGGYAQWRDISRSLLHEGVEPERLVWLEANAPGAGDLFADKPVSAPTAAPSRITIPKRFSDLLDGAARCRQPHRWALMYRALWRMAQGDRSAMLVADIDGGELHRRAHLVRREAHHMEAFVRFRSEITPAGLSLLLAWHEPAHDVLALVVDHFMARMGRQAWMIVTPDAAACSDGERLTLIDDPAPALGMLARSLSDPTDELWRAYYRNTFNPARVNLQLTRRHMPARFWRDLTEGDLIPAMTSQARLARPNRSQTEDVARQPGRQVAVSPMHAQPLRSPASPLDACRRCARWRDATCAIAGEGPEFARMMVIGAQPGDREDLAGRPFVGAEGTLLEQALEAAGLSRAQLYLTYALKHFKGRVEDSDTTGRRPAAADASEYRACSTWLAEELAQIRPNVVLVLGMEALSALEMTAPASTAPSQRDIAALSNAWRHGERWVVSAPALEAIGESTGEQRSRLLAQLQVGLETAHRLSEAADGSAESQTRVVVADL